MTNVNKKAQREFGLSLAELLAKDPNELGDDEREFLRYYNIYMPVSMGECVVNRICKRFEQAFDGHMRRHSAAVSFDYEILKSGAEYTRSQYDSVLNLYQDYNCRLREYSTFARRERVDGDEAVAFLGVLRDEFRAACDSVCPNAECLCDILLDICYRRKNTKQFVWDLCGEEIVGTLLKINGGVINFPVCDPGGDIDFHGNKFSLKQKEVDKEDWTLS